MDSVRTIREYGPEGGGYLPTPTQAEGEDEGNDHIVPRHARSSFSPVASNDPSVDMLLKQQAMLMEQMKTLGRLCEENQEALSSLGTIIRARRPHGSSRDDA